MILEPCVQMTSTLSFDCLVTENMISVLTHRCVMKPGGSRLCSKLPPHTSYYHLHVPLTPADCDAGFNAYWAHGICCCTLQRAQFLHEL